MKIIKCNLSHLEKVTELYDKVTLYLERNINYPKWVYGVYPGRDSVKLVIEQGVQYMCLEGKEVVGAFIFNDNPQGNYEKGHWSIPLHQGEYMVIHTLATDPTIAGKGIGTFMVEQCIQMAKDSGYKGVRLDVVPDNIPAIKLYEKCGFQFTGLEDLERDIEEIPLFSLYEYVLSEI